MGNINNYEIWDAHVRGFRATAPNGDKVDNAGRGYNSREECVAAIQKHIRQQRTAAKPAAASEAKTR